LILSDKIYECGKIKKAQFIESLDLMTFKEAFSFMQKVAAAAEQANHHPKWRNEYNIVEVWLSTHEAGGKITNKDRQLADAIDQIYEEHK
jgi:4a-hydroxytetrahydrobiopterin dehydratase